MSFDSPKLDYNNIKSESVSSHRFELTVPELSCRLKKGANNNTLRNSIKAFVVLQSFQTGLTLK